MSAVASFGARITFFQALVLVGGCTGTSPGLTEAPWLASDQAVELEERVDFNPSGPTTIRTWRESLTRRLTKIEFVDVRPGGLGLIGARLIRNAIGEWRVIFADNSTCALYRPADSLPHRTSCIDQTGAAWEVLVSGASSPRVIPGLVSEDEFKLTLSFTAAGAGPPR